MKKLNLLKTAFVAIFAVVAFSCSDDDSSSSNTIVSIASKNENLSSLVAALNRAGLTSTLNGSGSFTVFAPTNTAFAAFLSANGFANLEAVPVPVLRQVLLNHVVTGNVQAAQLPEAGYIKTSATFGGTSTGNTLSMYVNKSSGVRLNGVATVTTANVIASNGVVHIVDAVIALPTVVTFAVADPTFNILEAALTREGDNITDFVSVLSGTGPFTVFAPTDAAFGDLLTELNLPGLASIPESILDPVLKYHVATGTFGNVLSTGLTPNGVTNVPTLLGATPTINITLPGTGGNIANVTDGAGRPSGIIAVDVQAANGVIHVLNKVLLPGN
jgi:uncharacterized surface protein with fasciclin (FAS1) repeats